MKPETQEWIDKAEGDSLAIHIALLPDKSGFKTGARILEILTSYRHIAPSEREAKLLNFNDNLMDFQQLGSVDIRVSRCESRPTGYLSVLDRLGGSGKMPALRV